MHSNQHKTHPPDSLQLVFTGPIPCTDGAVVVSCDAGCFTKHPALSFLFPEPDGATENGERMLNLQMWLKFADFVTEHVDLAHCQMAVDPVAVETGLFMPNFYTGRAIQVVSNPHSHAIKRPFGRGPTNPVMGLTNYSQIIVAATY